MSVFRVTLPSKLAFDAAVNEETNLLQREQKSHSDTGLYWIQPWIPINLLFKDTKI